MIDKSKFTGAPENNRITVVRMLGDTQFTTEVYLGGDGHVSVTKIATTLTAASLDDTAKAIEIEQQEIGRAILELFR